MVPVNEKYSRVLQDVEISITRQSTTAAPHPTPPREEDNTSAPSLCLLAPSLFSWLAEQTLGAVSDKCSRTAFRFYVVFSVFVFFFVFLQISNEK